MPGVRIDLRKIDELIQRKGVWIDWIRASKCPCQGANGYPALTCPGCKGLGWLRAEPRRMKALVTSQNRRGDRTGGGEVDTGSRQLTPPRWVRVGEGDWVVVLEGASRASEIIEWSGKPDGERLDALFPVEVLAVRVVRSGGVHDFAPASYQLVEDRIVWLDPADAPRPGEQVSVELKYQEAYQIVRGDKGMNRYAESKRLPDRVNMRLLTRRVLKERS